MNITVAVFFYLFARLQSQFLDLFSGKNQIDQPVEFPNGRVHCNRLVGKQTDAVNPADSKFGFYKQHFSDSKAEFDKLNQLLPLAGVNRLLSPLKAFARL